MADQFTSSGSCQVDFYLLGKPSMPATGLACRLALMAWERKQKIFVITNSNSDGEALVDLMWQFPENRFLPHAHASEVHAGKAPVIIGVLSSLIPTDVVINLCPEAVPEPQRFSRVLEIVPFAEEERTASRVKYRDYMNQGLKPQTHDING